MFYSPARFRPVGNLFDLESPTHLILVIFPGIPGSDTIQTSFAIRSLLLIGELVKIFLDLYSSCFHLQSKMIEV